VFITFADPVINQQHFIFFLLLAKKRQQTFSFSKLLRMEYLLPDWFGRGIWLAATTHTIKILIILDCNY
jgi:hypothetical protein